MLPITRPLAPICILACGLAMSTPATAVMHTLFSYQNPAAACQLNTPTTDTQVRPKATGYRNESTSNSAFVICGIDKPGSDTLILGFDLMFISIDGNIRTINCTAVTGIAGFSPLIYSAKSAPSIISGGFSYIGWASPDFSGTEDPIPYGYEPSVTCALPPQTAITAITTSYNLDIGN